MSVLVACEESQAVTEALRKKGIDAFSCDILPTSGKHPEWHIQGDCMRILDYGWKAVIAFPPCTHLCVSGARYWREKRIDGRQFSAVEFVMRIYDCPAQYVAIENPIGVLSSLWRKPDQIIQPWQFGHTEQKATCLWLGNLPKLSPTHNVFDEMMTLPKNKRQRIHYLPPSEDRATLRSKTYQGIACAMAEQWANIIG